MITMVDHKRWPKVLQLRLMAGQFLENLEAPGAIAGHPNIDPAKGVRTATFLKKKTVYSVISIDVSESIRVYPSLGGW